MDSHKKWETPRRKVDGQKREWYVWEWNGASWSIIAGPYLTSGRAKSEMQKLKG